MTTHCHTHTHTKDLPCSQRKPLHTLHLRSSFHCLLPHRFVLPLISKSHREHPAELRFNSSHAVCESLESELYWLHSQSACTIILCSVGMYERRELRQVLDCDRQWGVHSHDSLFVGGDSASTTRRRGRMIFTS